MKYYYRVSSPNQRSVTYTTSRYSADVMAGIIEGNGYKAVVERLTKKDIPLSEIDLINEL